MTERGSKGERNHEILEPFGYDGLYGRLFLASRPDVDIDNFLNPDKNVDVPVTVIRHKKDYTHITQILSSDEREKAWEHIPTFEEKYRLWKTGVVSVVNGLTGEDSGKLDALRLVMSEGRRETLTSANFTVEDARKLFETFCNGESNTDEFIKRTVGSLTPNDLTNPQKLSDLEWVSRKLFGQHTSEAISRILELEVKIQNRPRTKTVKEAIFPDPTRVNNLNSYEKDMLEYLCHGLKRPPQSPSTGPTANRKPFDLKPLRIKEILEEEAEEAKAAAAADFPAPKKGDEDTQPTSGEAQKFNLSDTDDKIRIIQDAIEAVKRGERPNDPRTGKPLMVQTQEQAFTYLSKLLKEL